MNVPTCVREADVVEAVASGAWETSVDRELAAHVDVCPVCADVVVVARAMRDAHVLACQEARVPSAGVVWWRAELRARQEAARAAARPMTFVQVIAGACGVGAVLTLASLLSPWMGSTLGGLIVMPPLHLPEVDATVVTSLLAQGGRGLLLAVGAWLVLVPIAVYFVLARD